MSEEKDDGQHRQAAPAASCDPAGAAGAGDDGAVTASVAGAVYSITGARGFDPFAAGNGLTFRHKVMLFNGLIVVGAPLGSRHVWGDPAEPVEDAGIRVGEVVAWRVWNLHKGLLWSVATNHEWVPGEPMTGDVSTDGVHAFKDAGEAVRYGQGNLLLGVLGQVAMWGQVIEHEAGWRAEFAKIVRLERIFHSAANIAQFGPATVPIEIIYGLRELYGLPAGRPKEPPHSKVPAVWRRR